MAASHPAIDIPFMKRLQSMIDLHALRKQADAEGLRIRFGARGLPHPTPPRYVLLDGDGSCAWIVEADAVEEEKEKRESQRLDFAVTVTLTPKRGDPYIHTEALRAGSEAGASWQGVRNAKTGLRLQRGRKQLVKVVVEVVPVGRGGE